MGTSRSPTLSLILLCVLGALVHSSSATTHKVSWGFTTSPSFYDDWAASQVFQVGDVLAFDYSAGTHNVIEVSAKDAAVCDASKPLQQWNDASAKVTLDSPGTHSFICGFITHCAQGMKLTLQVLADTPAPAPPAPPAPKLPPPTKPPPTPVTPELPPPPPKRTVSTPPPKPESPVEAPVLPPVPSPPKKRRSQKPLSAPAPAPVAPATSPGPADSSSSIAPSPFPETAAAAPLAKYTALVIVATVVVSYWAILF